MKGMIMIEVLVCRILKWLWVKTGHSLPVYELDLTKPPIPFPPEEHSFAGVVRAIVYGEYIDKYDELM